MFGGGGRGAYYRKDFHWGGASYILTCERGRISGCCFTPPRQAIIKKTV